jgi:hypothetical protein
MPFPRLSRQGRALLRIAALPAGCLMLPGMAGAHSALFTAFSLEARSDYVVPMGNLRSVLDPGAGMGLRLSSPYYRSLDAFVFLDVARLAARDGTLPVLFGGGGPGLEWAGLPAWLPRPGGGAALYLARIGADDDPENRYEFLHGGESEFGIFASLRWEVSLGRRLALSAGARWDEILTSPESSRMFAASLGIGWRWH